MFSKKIMYFKNVEKLLSALAFFSCLHKRVLLLLFFFPRKKCNTVFYLVKIKLSYAYRPSRALVIRQVAPITIIAPRAHEASALPDELGNWKPISWGVGIRPVTVSCVVTKAALLLSRSHSVGPVLVQPWMKDAFCKNLIIYLGHPLVS